MSLSQKCQYAVRAVLELSKRYGQGAVPAGEIAASQSAPQRFLEVILNELKPTGLVGSRRGVQGGYYLSDDPKTVTVGQIIRVVDGPLDPVICFGDKTNTTCPVMGKCALEELWGRAKEAITGVYDSTTFQDLIDRQRDIDSRSAPDYCI